MLEFIEILSFVFSLPPLVTVKCLNYKKPQTPTTQTAKNPVIYLFVVKKKGERGREDTVSKYTTEGKLLHFFSYLTVCIAFVRQKILYGHIEPTVFKCKH